ncbi:Sensor histidine kinase desK [Mycobacteroides abscessus subsp. abscessus]|nr:Sensor histidine kinase desK [Mycobacteroides abscessus subsp. abscessus]
MKVLTIKIGILLFLCVGALYQAYETDSWNFALLLFLLSIILGCYFLVPVFKRKSIPVFFILMLLEMTQFVIARELTGYLLLLMFYFTMELGTYVSTNLYRMIICLFLLMNVGIGFIVFSYAPFIWISLFLLISYLLIRLNDLDEDYQEIRDTYESLLNDYRIQKRKSYHNEHAARVEERNLIARDMHDSVGHKLTALMMQVEQFLIKEKKEEYKLIKNMTEECLEETRKAVRLLQVEEPGGIAPIITLIKKLESENNIYVHFTTKQGVLQVNLSNKQSAVLYRSIQEGITNAMKYGSSKAVHITLGVSPIGNLTFEIRNPYIHKHPFHYGFGLENMRNRIEEGQGKLEVLQLNGEFILQGNIPVGGTKNDSRVNC